MNNGETPAPSISIRPRAVEDIERYADYLEENATPDVALRFRAAIMDTIDQIAFMPQAGASIEVKNAQLSGLRMWVVPDFRKYLAFYITPEGCIEIVRVLHGAQDTNSILEDEG